MPGEMSAARVVFLNGPPRCGKDTAGKFLANSIPHSSAVKIAAALKRVTHARFGLYDVADDYFERCKDEPSPALFGLVPRQEYIAESEIRTKPFLGDDHFGRVLARQMWRQYQSGTRRFFVTDSGFAAEAEPVVTSIGPDNCVLVRIHAEERGCDFTNDSRSYIEIPSIVSYDIENNDTREDFCLRLLALLGPFLSIAA